MRKYHRYVYLELGPYGHDEDVRMVNYSDLIAERTKDFTGREWVFAKIDRWLTPSLREVPSGEEVLR